MYARTQGFSAKAEIIAIFINYKTEKAESVFATSQSRSTLGLECAQFIICLVVIQSF